SAEPYKPSQNFKLIRDKFKLEKQGERAESQDKEKNVFEFLNAPWGGHNRGQNFTRARSGTGGGHVGWSSPPKEVRESLEKKKKGIKDVILQAKAVQKM